MIFLRLFLTFLIVGAVSFGGGYGMIALLREEVVGAGWLTDAEFLDFIAVSESTPGPIAINMATFVGTSQGGLAGAACATLGVILPAFLIILLIAALLRNLLRYRGVSAFLYGVRPAVTGLICATGVTFFASALFRIETYRDNFAPDWRSIVIFALLAAAAFLWKKFSGKRISPILLILISAGAGMLLFGVLGNAEL